VGTLANPILQVLDDYKTAVLAKDVDSFVALYDQDLRVFDMWGSWSYDGIDAWRDMATRWFGSLGTERVVVEFSDAQSIVGQEIALIHAFVKYRAITTEGKELRSMDNRLTVTLRQKADGWKIVPQHTSSPIDPATVSVIFKRE
jgi:ketosteroid isomerase-like protein